MSPRKLPHFSPLCLPFCALLLADAPLVGAQDSGDTRSSLSREASQSAESAPDKLVGTWVAKNVETDSGQADIRLTFREEGPLKLMAWSDLWLVGQVRDKTAPYKVTENTISSEAIRGGTVVKYRFSPSGNLIIEYQDGETVEFQRASSTSFSH